MSNFSKHRSVVCAVTVLGFGALVLIAPLAGHAQEAPAGLDVNDQDRRVDVLEYRVQGNTVLDKRSIERAVMPFLGLQRSMQDIERARDALQVAYQNAGYQSIYVDLPTQQVTQGIVILQVSETTIGRLRVTGNQYTSARHIREQVPALREGEVPNFNSAQSQLTALNTGANRQVMPLVRQGAFPGTMDVDLQVEDHRPLRLSAGLNNDNSPDTEDLRATATVGYSNLWQRGHSLSLTFFGAPQDFDQTEVWTMSYVMPLAGSDWSIEGTAYTSNSNVATIGGTNVLGEGTSVGVKATYTVPNTERWWHAISVGLELKDNDESVRLGGGGDDIPLRYAPFTLGYAGYTQTERSQYSLGLSLVGGTQGFFGYSSDEFEFDNKRFNASRSFVLLKGDVNATFSLPASMQVVTRISTQVANGPLVSGEQFASGGMFSVRGYFSAEATGDYGISGSLEVRSMPITPPIIGRWVDSWRAYLFTDGARLALRETLPEQDGVFSLWSVGVGTSLDLGRHVAVRLDYGNPLRKGLTTKRDDARLNFSINISY